MLFTRFNIWLLSPSRFHSAAGRRRDDFRRARIAASAAVFLAVDLRHAASACSFHGLVMRLMLMTIGGAMPLPSMEIVYGVDGVAYVTAFIAIARAVFIIMMKVASPSAPIACSGDFADMPPKASVHLIISFSFPLFHGRSGDIFSI